MKKTENYKKTKDLFLRKYVITLFLSRGKISRIIYFNLELTNKLIMIFKQLIREMSFPEIAADVSSINALSCFSQHRQTTRVIISPELEREQFSKRKSIVSRN